MRSALLLSFSLFITISCTDRESATAPSTPSAERPSILLVTLDTTRADAMTAEVAPVFNALAARGIRYRQAYATVPQTLPSHASMMTGLYPAGHGVHENGRFLTEVHPTAAERLRQSGYRTAAFVSAFAVAKRFGLGRGFEVYDESFGENVAERGAKDTTDRAIAHLEQASDAPQFIWVHYYDPHYPYTPPEPYKTRYAANPYLGEVASMDEQMGRLVAAFEKSAKGRSAIIVSADHGEGLGDHGEAQHGNLLYQSTMHIPMLIAGPGVQPGASDTPVSLRRIYFTILDWAGVDAANSLRGNTHEAVVVGEAMKPFLDYGWQPQVMAVEGRQKAIMAGRLELYDVIADAKETKDMAESAAVPRAIRATLRDYPLPNPAAAAPASSALDAEAQRKLASLGYVSAAARPVVRADAPVPADMTSLFPILDRASGLFVREYYDEAIPLLLQIRKADPNNLDAALRLATAYSATGRDAQAVAAFEQARTIAPDSRDVRTYLGLHYAKGREWEKAIPLLERSVAEEPDRLPPLEALAVIREKQGRIDEVLRLREKIFVMRAPSAAELVSTARMQMSLGQTEAAIGSFEKARALQGDGFRDHLELGVLYLAARRLEQARDALDRVPPSHPGYAMALFKRAQVSVLLNEEDRAARIAAARAKADATTRELIERERLFQ